MGIETPKIILGGDLKKAHGWLGFARQKLNLQKAIQGHTRIMDGLQGLKGLQGVRGVHGNSAVVNKMYKPVMGTKVLIKSFDGIDYINIYVNKGVLCQTSFTRTYYLEDDEDVARWTNTLWDETEVAFETRDKHKDADPQTPRRWVWEYGDGAFGGGAGVGLGLNTLRNHHYAEVGEKTVRGIAFDLKDQESGLEEFPTLSGEIKVYHKQTPAPLITNGWLNYSTNAAAWAAWNALPWILTTTKSGTDSGNVNAGFQCSVSPGFFIAPSGPTIPDYYRYAGTKVERTILLTQAEAGGAVLFPNGFANPTSTDLVALGWNHPGRYGVIKNKTTGEQLGTFRIGGNQPYANWTNLSKEEDINVEYTDEEGWGILQDPVIKPGPPRATGTIGWTMEVRGSLAFDDGLYYKTYTCLAKASKKVKVV